MRCEDAEEFVSALCDGERIPREAAEHIGECEKCRTWLQDYAMLGAEIRRTASLNSPKNVSAIQHLLTSTKRAKEKRSFEVWWKKGAEAMRIPRFAFVLMLLLIVGLSSGLVVVRARSNAQGPVLLVTLKLPNSDLSWQCALSMNGHQNGVCSGGMDVKKRGFLEFGIQFLARQGDKIALGIRRQFLPLSPNGGSFTFFTADLENLPIEQYELEPGQKLQIDIEGLGKAELTGELLDHMPVLPLAPHATLDPAQDELRMISPLLLRGREAIIDMDHGSATGTGKDGAVWIYAPGVGRLILSAENFQGAVKGHVSQSRIDFEIGGRQYQLLAGAPITRAQDVWVQFDPNFQSSESPAGAIGWANLDYLLAKQATPD